MPIEQLDQQLSSSPYLPSLSVIISRIASLPTRPLINDLLAGSISLACSPVQLLSIAGSQIHILIRDTRRDSRKFNGRKVNSRDLLNSGSIKLRKSKRIRTLKTFFNKKQYQTSISFSLLFDNIVPLQQNYLTEQLI